MPAAASSGANCGTRGAYEGSTCSRSWSNVVERERRGEDEVLNPDDKAQIASRRQREPFDRGARDGGPHTRDDTEKDVRAAQRTKRVWQSEPGEAQLVEGLVTK